MTACRRGLIALIALLACCAVGAPARAEGVGPLLIAKQGYFFVGGHYVDLPDGQFTAGQIYVEYQIPKKRRHPYPIVMIEGGGQSGSNFTGTPDGRDGWAQYFLAQGYAVYIADQPGRGRSAFVAGAYGKNALKPAKIIQDQFTAPERRALWPQAHLHTQWPGTGVIGDAAFDQFEAEQLPDLLDATLLETLNREAGAALLDKIGPAILMTHSQSGAFGLVIADARPALVKAIVGIEPGGPPFYGIDLIGAPDWFKNGPLGKPWGLTRTPVQYAPAVSDPKELSIAQQDKADGPGLVRCWLQAGRPHELVNLKRVPQLMVTAEASFHAPWDHCNAAFLRQAGVKVDYVRLEQRGIHGNGHMMMLEKNNLQIAALIARWLNTALPAHAAGKPASR
jgi:pimeloyl-ACP methyl ester carboxylesterase